MPDSSKKSFEFGRRRVISVSPENSSDAFEAFESRTGYLHIQSEIDFTGYGPREEFLVGSNREMGREKRVESEMSLTKFRYLKGLMWDRFNHEAF